MRVDGLAGELRRVLVPGEAGGAGRRVREAAIELGELRRGDAGAGRGRDAQFDCGRGGVPRAQVARRRPPAARALIRRGAAAMRGARGGRVVAGSVTVSWR
jgi:hypothetical protein